MTSVRLTGVKKIEASNPGCNFSLILIVLFNVFFFLSLPYKPAAQPQDLESRSVLLWSYSDDGFPGRTVVVSLSQHLFLPLNAFRCCKCPEKKNTQQLIDQSCENWKPAWLTWLRFWLTVIPHPPPPPSPLTHPSVIFTRLKSPPTQNPLNGENVRQRKQQIHCC